MKEISSSGNKKQINEIIKELVIARIEAQIAPNLRLSIGNFGSLSKEEMIENISKESEIGKMIMDVHLNFIKAQSSGALISALNSV